MTRRLSHGERLCVASHNAGKVREIRALIEPFGMTAISAGELDLPEPEETEKTFIGNAELKARAAAEASKLPSLSDDSGLEVHGLGGAPGIYSARWAGPEKNFDIAMEKVMAELGARDHLSDEKRSANFTCALSLAWPDGACVSFEGKVFGHLVWPMRGDRGFGYDPIFVAEGRSETFGEMDPEEKHAISHRAAAFAQFKAACLPQETEA